MNDSRFKKLIQVLLVLLSLTQLNSQNLTLTTPNCYDNGTVTYSMYANITNYLQHNNNIDKRDIINKPADLKNKTVGVLPGMPINLGNYGKVTTFPNTEDLIKALKNHTIDGIIVDENTNDYIALHNYDLIEIPEKIDTVEYGPIFNKKFTDPFNEFASKTNIQNLMEDWSGINYDVQIVDKNLNGNNGTIRAVSYLGNRPYAYKDEKGEPTGSCLDLIYSFAKSAGYKVEFKEVSTYDDQIDVIKNGNADMSCAYITDSLKNDVGTINNNPKQNVSSIIRLSNSEKSNENENKQYYETYKDLDGKKLGVLSDSVFDNVTKKHFSNSELVYYKDTFHLFKSLFTDEIEGFLTDVPNAEDFQKRFPEKVSYFGENFYNNSYGFAFKNNNSQIFKDFQSYLYATGNKLNAYYEKWRNDDNPPTIDKTLNKSAPTIRVAMFPDTKLICFEQNKEITGYEIQLLYEFAKEKNYNIELITLENSGERISYITEDKADITGGALTITPEREKLVNFSYPILLAGTNLVVSREKRKLPGKIQVLDENYTPKENNTISFPVKVGDKDTVSVCVFPENFEYNELSLINCTIPDLKGVDPTKNGLTLGTSNDTLGLNNVEYNPTNLLNGNTLLPGYPIINESDKTNYICYAEPSPTTVPPTTTPTTVTTSTPPLNNSTLTYYKSSQKRLSTGTIIGIIIPLAVALVGATIGAFLCRRGPPFFPAPDYSQRLDTSSYKFNVVPYYPKQIQVNQLPVQQVIPGQQIVPVQQVVTQQVVTDPTAVIVNNP